MNNRFPFILTIHNYSSHFSSGVLCPECHEKRRRRRIRIRTDHRAKRRHNRRKHYKRERQISGVCDKPCIAMMPMQYGWFYRCTGGLDIETGYKSAKAVRHCTTSTDKSVRIFMFFMYLFIYNLWIFLRIHNEHRLADLLMWMSLQYIVWHVSQQVTGSAMRWG